MERVKGRKWLMSKQDPGLSFEVQRKSESWNDGNATRRKSDGVDCTDKTIVFETSKKGATLAKKRLDRDTKAGERK